MGPHWHSFGVERSVRWLCGDDSAVLASSHSVTSRVVVMRIRLVLVIGATLALAACGESATAPQTMRPGARSADEISCRSGYHIATRADGTEYCEGDDGFADAPMITPADSGQ
jgi:hypothetical protein